MKKGLLTLMLLVVASVYSQNWKANFEDAKATAAKENKNIVLVFSGSDWCAPCIKLDKVVWQSEEFKKEAEKNWVTYKADFPKKKANQLAPELTEANKKAILNMIEETFDNKAKDKESIDLYTKLGIFMLDSTNLNLIFKTTNNSQQFTKLREISNNVKNNKKLIFIKKRK